MIKLKTELPGPRSKALEAERKKYVPRGVASYTHIYVVKAHGAELEDVDGNHLLDFAAGIAVTNVGHSPERVVRAVQEQASRFLHASINVTPYEGYVRLSERLNRVTPGSFPKKTLLVNSGAEAVENAIKIARAATGRTAVVCFEHAYHGRPHMAMTLTSHALPYKVGFGPYCPDVYRAPFPYLYRWPGTGEEGGEQDFVAEECFRQFEDMVAINIDASQVAAVIIEPVQGEGGFLPAPVKFLKKLQAFCRENGIVFIADEVQTGFGRTGTLLACERLGAEPDIVTMGKGLGAGMPISAVTGRADIMDAVGVGGIGGTYAGNPLSCASALEVLDMFEDGSLLERARAMEEPLRQRLLSWKDRYEFIGNVQGIGTMQAMEIVKSRATKEPDWEAAWEILTHCYKRGLVILSAGTYDSIVRLLMPLVIEPEQLEEGLDVLETALQALKT
jgi:4-aminobutyrate aminotransferase/(S)-3-amino-2-methylpropionate transaminase